MEKDYRTRRIELENSFLFKLFWSEKRKKKNILDLAKKEYSCYLGKYYVGDDSLLYVRDIVLWSDKESKKWIPCLKMSVLKETDNGNGFTIFTQLLREHDYKIEIVYSLIDPKGANSILSRNMETLFKNFNWEEISW